MTRRRRGAAVAAALGALVLGAAHSAGAEGSDVAAADRLTVALSAGALVHPAAPLLDVALGRFVGDLVEVGVRQEGGLASGSGRHDWHLATMPFVDLHLARDPKWLLTPFVGVAGGALYDDRSTTGVVGPEAGVKLFLSETLFVAARYQFRWAAEPLGGVGRESHVLLLGAGMLLGGDDPAELARAEASAARAEEAAASAEQAVARLERAVERLERAVDEFARWFEEQLRK